MKIRKYLYLLMVVLLMTCTFGCSAPEEDITVAEEVPTPTPTPTPVPIPDGTVLVNASPGFSVTETLADMNIDGTLKILGRTVDFSGNLYGTVTSSGNDKVFSFDTAIKKAGKDGSEDGALDLNLYHTDGRYVLTDGGAWIDLGGDGSFPGLLEGFLRKAVSRIEKDGTVEKSTTGYRFISTVKLNELFTDLEADYGVFEESILNAYRQKLESEIMPIYSEEVYDGEGNLISGGEDLRYGYIEDMVMELKEALEATYKDMKGLPGTLTYTINTDSDGKLRNRLVSFTGLKVAFSYGDIVFDIAINSLNGQFTFSEAKALVKPVYDEEMLVPVTSVFDGTSERYGQYYDEYRQKEELAEYIEGKVEPIPDDLFD